MERVPKQYFLKSKSCFQNTQLRRGGKQGHNIKDEIVQTKNAN